LEQIVVIIIPNLANTWERAGFQIQSNKLQSRALMQWRLTSTYRTSRDLSRKSIGSKNVFMSPGEDFTSDSGFKCFGRTNLAFRCSKKVTRFRAKTSRVFGFPATSHQPSSLTYSIRILLSLFVWNALGI